MQLMLAIIALSSVGCARAPTPAPNAVASTDGNLALEVRYTSLCATPSGNNRCPSVSYPQVCWSGACTSECGGAGTRAFQICAPGGTRTDDPTSIEQAITSSHLMPGAWKLHAESPGWKLDCSVQVYAGKTSFSVIDSAQRSCLRSSED